MSVYNTLFVTRLQIGIFCETQYEHHAIHLLETEPPPTDHIIFSGQKDGLLCLACLVESSKRWGAHKGMVTSDIAYERTRIIMFGDQ